MAVRAIISYFSKLSPISTEQQVATVANLPLVPSTAQAPAASITIRSGTQTCSTQAQESRWVQIITPLGRQEQAIHGTTISFPTPKDPQSMPSPSLSCQYPSIWCHPAAMQALTTTSQSWSSALGRISRTNERSKTSESGKKKLKIDRKRCKDRSMSWRHAIMVKRRKPWRRQN